MADLPAGVQHTFTVTAVGAGGAATPVRTNAVAVTGAAPPLMDLSVSPVVTAVDEHDVVVSGRTAPHTMVRFGYPGIDMATSGADGRFSAALDLGHLPDGSHSLEVTATDPRDVAATGHVSFEKQARPPEMGDVTVLDPVRATRRGEVAASVPARTTLTAVAVDREGTVVRVGKHTAVPARLRLSLDMGGFVDGEIAVWVFAERDGLRSVVAQRTSRLDTAPPVLSGIHVPSSAPSNEYEDLVVRATTEPRSVVRIVVSHRTRDDRPVEVPVPSGTHGGLAAVIDTSSLPDGEWVVSMTATDEAGNVGPTVLRTVRGYRHGPVPAYSSAYVPLTPSRVLDTRHGDGVRPGLVGPGQTVRLPVTGRGGVPSAGVTAVALNVTVVAPSAATYVTVWPSGAVRPTTSNLNVPAGDTRPNLVVTKVGSSGQVDLYNATGSTHLVGDVAGYYTDTGTGGSTFVPVSPARLLDTRSGNGAPEAPVGPGRSIDVPITGRGGVPSSGVTAVVLNVTAVSPTASTYVTVWPTGTSRPTASNLNAPAGAMRPNLVTAKVGSGGRVSLYNAAGSTHLLADVAGYFTSSSSGSRYVPLAPTRLMDTRRGKGVRQGAVDAGRSVHLGVPGLEVPGDAVAVVLNTT
ncbi:MAG TPA: hypothetical protein VNU26_02655, partial [Mycobacteriales bacterium]|nr:hypothetical protein [Mycobacteriales bacterium]